MEAFAETLIFARKTWWSFFGTKQLHLRVLATHPDYQRRGAATQHCKWGMKPAKEQDVAIALFSSSVGNESSLWQKFYSHIGFETLARLCVQVEGEKEKLFIGLTRHTES